MEPDIDRRTLSGQVYDALRRDILTGRISLGSRLTNALLQQRFGVSAIPIRDALIRLEQDGMIEEISRAGALVAAPNLCAALEINEIAALLCVSAVRLAGTHADRPQLSKALSRSLLGQEAYIGQDLYFDYDYDFHIAFLEHCGNSQYKKVYHQYSMMLEMLSRWSVSVAPEKVPEARARCIESHRKICSAFLAGDIENAASWMERHYEDGAEQLKAYFEK